MGAAITSSVHSTTYTFIGKNNLWSELSFYNERVYSFNSTDDVDFISLRVDVPELKTVDRSGNVTTGNEESTPRT